MRKLGVLVAIVVLGSLTSCREGGSGQGAPEGHRAAATSEAAKGDVEQLVTPKTPTELPKQPGKSSRDDVDEISNLFAAPKGAASAAPRPPESPGNLFEATPDLPNELTEAVTKFTGGNFDEALALTEGAVEKAPELRPAQALMEMLVASVEKRGKSGRSLEGQDDLASEEGRLVQAEREWREANALLREHQEILEGYRRELGRMSEVERNYAPDRYRRELDRMEEIDRTSDVEKENKAIRDYEAILTVHQEEIRDKYRELDFERQTGKIGRFLLGRWLGERIKDIRRSPEGTVVELGAPEGENIEDIRRSLEEVVEEFRRIGEDLPTPPPPPEGVSEVRAPEEPASLREPSEDSSP